MATGLSALLLLVVWTLIQGMLLPPHNVTLTSENFHIFLRWEPGHGSHSGNQYEVESCSRSSKWTKVDTCWKNSTRSFWTCKLFFEDIHILYWARVRAVNGVNVSKWVISNELQPYRDTIVGPLKLMLWSQDQNLTVDISIPLTPYQRKNGSYKSVQKVLSKLRFVLRLYEEGVFLLQVICKPKGKKTQHTFQYLKPNTNYCIRAREEDSAKSKEAVQCTKTKLSPRNFLWDLVVALIVFTVLLLLGAAGLYFLKLYVYPSISEIPFPRVLTVLNEEPNMKVCTKASACDLEGDSFSLLSVTGLSSTSHFTIEQKKTQTQLLPRGYHAQKVDEYCANGFDLVYHDSKTSCSSSNKLSFAGAVDSEASLSSAGLVKGSDSSEGQYMSALKTQLPDGFLVSPKKPSPVSTVLVQDGYTSDSHYQTGSGTPTPLNLQIYSKRTSLVSESINSIPSYHSGATFSKDLKKKISSMRTEWPPLCWVGIPLSSVKLQASEKTGGHLVPSLGDLCKCSPPTMKDYSVQKASLGQSAKACQEYLPVSQEQCDLLEHTDCSNDASSDSSPEANSTTKKTSFGYELHPQAWSCTQ
ncbi:interleukin-10 receptor subunit alpha-like isoform X1 [Alligator sinensis]|uniref:Interleukin-10 receptor subunit alpha-like isoform X1 n=1 Tax=Alligator sinensis TaxID=38654 RepID=A0A3Q0GU59_ALLSI|nr:interleukin-10 receptor subunit alpha-like isoform X1 [Alligator sinensis]XP_025061740.1 interleukin-10 receptor subunit alpha-like isoform X1 [Alligator sinensis]